MQARGQLPLTISNSVNRSQSMIDVFLLVVKVHVEDRELPMGRLVDPRVVLGRRMGRACPGLVHVADVY
jgi:hypothetical protein